MATIFTAPLQCAESLHLGTLVSLLHTDIIHRLRKSCGIESAHLLFWNVTGKHAEKAALSLGLDISESGCREAISELVRRNLEEIANWNIDVTAVRRDDQSDITDIEHIFDTLQSQGRLVQNADGWNLVVDKQYVLKVIEKLPVVPSIRNKLKQCMGSFPAFCILHKERVYASKIAGYDNLSLDPKLGVALMPVLYGKSGTLVLGEDVIERMLLHHLIISPSGCELAQGVVHGMLWGDDGKKMSRYTSNAVKAGDFEINPDIARASILARPIMSGMKFENLQTAQARQLCSQFERILDTVGIRIVQWSEPDSEYLQAVQRLDFQALFQWFRLIIKKELRGLVIKMGHGTATNSEIARTHILCNVIGATLFPGVYSQRSQR